MAVTSLAVVLLGWMPGSESRWLARNRRAQLHLSALLRAAMARQARLARPPTTRKLRVLEAQQAQGMQTRVLQLERARRPLAHRSGEVVMAATLHLIVMAAGVRSLKLQLPLMEMALLSGMFLAPQALFARRLGHSSASALSLLRLQLQLLQRRLHQGSAVSKQRACSGSTGCSAAWSQLEQPPMQAHDRWSSCLLSKLAEEHNPPLSLQVKRQRRQPRYLQAALGRPLLQRQLQCLPSHSR